MITSATFAKFYGIPYEGLQKTIDDYTRYAHNGKDEEFNKPFFKFKDMVPDLTKPPFYAWRAIPKVHHTMDGVKIDVEARVYNTDDKPIAGLLQLVKLWAALMEQADLVAARYLIV